jgi:hypothetical protein
MANLTITPIKTFISGETVTPSKLNELSQSTVALTAGSIVDADVSASAAIAGSKLADASVAGSKLADASVTQAKFAPSVILVPAGAVMPFAMNSAPTGWLAADGAAVSRSTYAALFAAVGTAHGAGDGSTTFNLPDLRGIFVRGSGSQTIGGVVYNKTFAGKENDQMQGHRHSITSGSFYYVGSGSLGASGGSAIPSQALSVGDPTSNGSNGTPRVGGETRPANIALLYCIKF